MRSLARVLVIAFAFAPACRREVPPASSIAVLQEEYDRLHERLEKAAARDPAVTSALMTRGQLVMGLRSGLIEEIAGNLARRYLDTIDIDLGDVSGGGEGAIRRDTFLGRVKVGEWKVRVRLGDLKGRIRVGWPKVSLRQPNFIDLEVPVEARETEGNARLDFAWDSAALANVICRDFEISTAIRGRVLKQKHVVSGALRLDNKGDRLIATPLVPDRSIALRLDLTAASWAAVEVALREQNTFGKCGTLIKPAVAMGFLRDLAKRGISVNLPRSIFRTVKAPGGIEHTVRVNDRSVGIGVQAESLTIETATLWSSARVQVRPAARPAN